MTAKRYKPQKRFRAKRSRLKKIVQSRFFWFGLILCFVLAGVGYGIFFTPIFQIKYIEVQGNQKVTKDQILHIVNASLWKDFVFFEINHFLFANAEHIEKEIRAAFSEIDSVKAKKKFPDSLQIIVQERQKVAIWCQQKSYTVEVADSENQEVRLFRQCFALDNHGVIFEEVEPEREVIISVENVEGSLLNKVVDENLLSNILQFQQALDTSPLFQEVGLRVSSFSIVSEERVHAKVSEGWEVYLNPSGRIDWQITKVKLVLEQEIPFEKRPFLEYIDLRFADQAYIKYR
ncbi:MAG: FtsQ-type POTRA domain-containing protein [Patescibacteria group bacterium]